MHKVLNLEVNGLHQVPLVSREQKSEAAVGTGSLKLVKDWQKTPFLLLTGFCIHDSVSARCFLLMHFW